MSNNRACNIRITVFSPRQPLAAGFSRSYPHNPILDTSHVISGSLRLVMQTVNSRTNLPQTKARTGHFSAEVFFIITVKFN